MELTGIVQGGSASSGARRSGRIRRRTAPGPKLGDDDDGGCSGPFRSRGSVRGLATRCRSSGARRRGEGVAVVMGTATMAASSARWCAREGNRGGNGVQGERGEVQGARASPWRREGVGEAATAKQEVEASACARACGVRPPGRGGRGQGGGGGGLGRPDGLASWAR